MKSRKQFYIDKEVQGAIVRRILYYWATCMLFLTIPLLISKTIVESDKLFYEHLSTLFYSYWPVYLVSALLLPFLIYDTLRVSHKFTGPIYHLRRELQNLLEGAVALAEDKIDLPLIRSLVGSADGVDDESLDLVSGERRHIERVIRLADGNKSAAAKILGIDRRTLQRKGF